MLGYLFGSWARGDADAVSPTRLTPGTSTSMMRGTAKYL
jgi:hypothetical protein